MRGVCWTLLLTVGACGQDGVSTDAQRSSARAVSSADDQTVTLITGDRVALRNGAPVVAPGPDRGQIAFSVERVGARVRVIPEDVAPLIASGQLDLALFDVT